MALLMVGASALWLTSVVLALWGIWLALRHFSPKPNHDEAARPEPISILKPVKGLDADLEANLVSFLTLDYPKYELLISIADPEDPARPLVESLIAKHSRIRARLFVGDVPLGPNPKVNNLVKSFAEARHDWILISDSNVRARPDDLKVLASEFTGDVGILTAVVRGERPGSFAGWLEAAFLNSFFARWMILAGRLGRPVVIGKTMLFRKSQAMRFGGMKILALYLAEDYMAGHAMRMLGLRIRVLSRSIGQPLGHYTFTQFWQRHLRWGRIRKSQAPIAYSLEPWTGAVASGLAGGWVFSSSAVFPFLPFFLIHMSAWCTLEMILLRRLGGRVSCRAAGAWIVRECLALPMWLHGVSGDTVNWRGKRLRVLKGGMLERTGS